MTKLSSGLPCSHGYISQCDPSSRMSFTPTLQWVLGLTTQRSVTLKVWRWCGKEHVVACPCLSLCQWKTVLSVLLSSIAKSTKPPLSFSLIMDLHRALIATCVQIKWRTNINGTIYGSFSCLLVNLAWPLIFAYFRINKFFSNHIMSVLHVCMFL